jgi:hypothetical protein
VLHGETLTLAPAAATAPTRIVDAG